MKKFAERIINDIQKLNFKIKIKQMTSKN